MKNARAFAFALLLFSVGLYSAVSQTVATGTYPYGSFVGGPDTVNLGNLNVNWQFPIINKAGRAGQNFVFDLAYDSSVWYPATSNGTTVWTPVSQWGWTGLQQNVGTTTFYYSSTLQSTGECQIGPQGQYGPPPLGTYYVYSVATLTYVDAWGVPHQFPGFNGVYIEDNNTTQYGCPAPGYGGPTTPATINASDGSGLAATYYQGSNRNVVVTITNQKTGATIVPTDAPGLMNGSTTYSSTDRNGNQITGNNGVYTDSLGQTALTVVSTNPGNAPPTVVMSYVNANGGTEYYNVNYSSYTVQTNFQCTSPAVTDYPPTSQYLVSSIETPDGRYYTFSYEPTPGAPQNTTGRIASVQLPTGGTISYQYTGSNDGINCGDGTTTGLTRTTPDATWTYSRSASGSTWTTLTTNTATQDQTVSTFLTGTSGPSTYFYEIERQAYSGPQSSGTLLSTTLTCYESSTNQSYCSNTAGDTGTSVGLPLSQVKHTNQYPNSTGIASGSLDQLDSSGNLTSQATYDYAHNGGAYGNLLQTTSWGYQSWQALNWYEAPTSVTVTDGSGAQLSQTTYVYDNGSSSPTVTSTSGTPQHIAISGPRANVTSVSRWVSGSTTQTTSYAYFDTGNVQTATDANGTNVTIYAYNYCGNSFLSGSTTPVKNPAGTVTATLTTSEAWSCTGGVPTSSTDANSNTTAYAYGSDPYWRPVSVTDAAGNVTSYSYSSNSSSPSSVSLSFNGGNSISNTMSYFDALGRTRLIQKQQGPGNSNYDSVSYSYDSYGRMQCQTEVPYTASAGLGSYVAPSPSTGKCTNYDALGRTTSTTDAAGGYIDYQYGTNPNLSAYTVFVTRGPAPSGENTKRRLLGYNGASQLTSVCEITSLAGSGSCGSGSGYNGYLTQYTYDGSRLIETQQNVQAGGSNVQTRQISYDGLGRKLSEKIPEWSSGNGSPGTTTYAYDSDSTCGSTSTGDLIKTTDNVGNVTCKTYDSLHRVLSSSVTSGSPYASVTPVANYVYDAASCNGTSMQNVAGSLAEAYTGTSGSKTTDQCFSNSFSTSGPTNHGVINQVWESTPHSGGYYVTTDTYFPNGALGVRSSTYGLPTMTYGLDGEGRPNAATDTTNGYNLVTAASYNAAGAATGIAYGNGDSDTFGYDSATSRPTSLLNTITGSNPFTMTTSLTWNANASLQQMQITDTNDSSKNQTCSYTADDLNRVASANCGASTWVQNFSYDAFGNINKAGNPGTTYAANYNPATNQVSSGITPAPQYDANGNQLTSTPATLSWNAWNVPISVNGTTATYDALGRMVEKVSGGTATEFVYGSDGTNIASVSLGALTKGVVQLPGGETAIYTSPSSAPYIRHTDWLGSSRLATTWGHAVQAKEAYAPFGETYDEAGTADRSFTGQEQNLVNASGAGGVYDSLFRKYDPSAGRWLSPDPAGWSATNLGDPRSLDRYAYVENQPLNLIDPLGTCGETYNWDSTTPMLTSAGVSDTDTTYGAPCDWFYLGPTFPGLGAGDDGDGNNSQPPVWSGGGSNGRNCSVDPATAGQYAAASEQVGKMTAGFFSGLGPDQYTFGPDSAVSQVMAQSGQFQDVLNQYYMSGTTSNWEGFGAAGFVEAGANPVAQFLGSFGWSITSAAGGIYVTITNITSFHSLMLDHGPAYDRFLMTVPTGPSSFAPLASPMGNVRQTITIKAVCH